MVYFKLFGDLEIYNENEKVEIKPTKGLKLLLYFVISQKTLFPKEEIYKVFWNGYPVDYARKNLNVHIYKLRKDYTFLEKILINNRDNVFFDRKYISSDYDIFMENVMIKFPKAFKVYDGELLEGFDDDWIIEKRKQCKKMFRLSLMIHRTFFYKIKSILEVQSKMRKNAFSILLVKDIKNIKLRKGDLVLELNEGYLLLLENGEKDSKEVINGFIRRTNAEVISILDEDNALYLIERIKGVNLYEKIY